MEAVLVALITSGFAWLIARENRNTKKINEMHRQVTVNHHSSENPTILDKLDDLQKAFNRHIQWHLEKDDE